MAGIDTNIEKETLQIRLRPFPEMAFPKQKLAWSPHTLGCAIDSGNGARGLIGHLLPPASYLARYGEAFVPTAEPGARPVGVARAELILYENTLAAYNTEQRVMKLFRNKLIIPITDSQELMPLLGLHVTVHRLHQNNVQALGHNMKIQLLADPLGPIGHFDQSIADFEIERPFWALRTKF